MNFEIGELIKWYETCANSDITKDAGVGIIIEIADINAFKSFRVFRIKKKDIVRLCDYDIDKLYKE
tara:strand:- start:178 stop:375 length:198 start_codon:yes stop_codon:yes gene_type:complete